MSTEIANEALQDAAQGAEHVDDLAGDSQVYFLGVGQSEFRLMSDVSAPSAGMSENGGLPAGMDGGQEQIFEIPIVIEEGHDMLGDGYNFNDSGDAFSSPGDEGGIYDSLAQMLEDSSSDDFADAAGGEDLMDSGSWI
ncbi:MAG: hypothetical protein IKR91_07425 [Alloprevotella sp.]|nr:hypothetical protein [Alloprevotella sp.]